MHEMRKVIDDFERNHPPPKPQRVRPKRKHTEKEKQEHRVIEIDLNTDEYFDTMLENTSRIYHQENDPVASTSLLKDPGCANVQQSNSASASGVVSESVLVESDNDILIVIPGLSEEEWEMRRECMDMIDTESSDINDSDTEGSVYDETSESITTIAPVTFSHRTNLNALSLPIQLSASTSNQWKLKRRLDREQMTEVKQRFMKHMHYTCDLTKEANRFYMPVLLEEKWVVQALLDSGSEVTLISKEIFDYMNQELPVESQMKLKPPPNVVHSVNGTEVPVIGISNLPIQLGKFVMKQPTLVVNLPNLGMILGQDCLSRLSPLIDYLNLILWSQVKKPISMSKLRKHNELENPHAIEQGVSSVEVHFKNTQVPSITEIILNRELQNMESSKKVSVVILDESQNWQTELFDNCLRFFVTPSENMRVIRDSKEVSIVESIVTEEEKLYVPIHLWGESLPVQAKIVPTCERSCISELDFMLRHMERAVNYEKLQNTEIHGLDHPTSTHSVIGRAFIEITIGDRKLYHNVLIVTEVREKFYVASDLLHKYADVIDISKLRILEKELQVSNEIDRVESIVQHESPDKFKNNHFEITYISGDLFTAPDDYALVHCVSADFAMTGGIAVQFKEKFGRVEELKAQRCKVGQVARIRVKNRFIYYLVTKERVNDLPSYQDLEKSLHCLREHCQRYDVQVIAMPKIATGIDSLNWEKVANIIGNVFRESKVKIYCYVL